MRSPLGKRIRDRRKQLRLSLRDVADRLGVPHVWWGEVERGQRWTLAKWHRPRLAVLLQVEEAVVEEWCEEAERQFNQGGQG